MNTLIVHEFVRTYVEKHTSRFLRFCIVGGVGTATDFGLFFFLTKMWQHTPEYVTAWFIPTICFEFSAIGNFLLSYYWVWRDRHGSFFISFLKYQSSVTFTFILRVTIFGIAVMWAHIDPATQFFQYALAYMIIPVFIIIANFLLINHGVFTEDYK